MCDLLIKNGKIIDGSGAPAFFADISVIDGKIQSIEPSIEIDCPDVLDASNMIVCPGFIDIHSHTDATIMVNNKAESKIRQGITTEVVGNCGMSAAPLTTAFLSEVRDHLNINSDYGKTDEIGKSWTTFKEYIAFLNELPLGINIMPMVGLGTLRSAVMGLKSGPPTKLEMRGMEDLLERSLKEGAAGMSTGLEYVPDSLCHPDELIQLCRVIERNNKLYASHIRNESQTLFPAIEEAIHTAEASGCRIEISHLKLGGKFNWGKTDRLFALLEKAISRGVRLSWDQYPYIAWGTGLVDYLPRWVIQDGHQKLIAYLSDTSTRKKIRLEINKEIKKGIHAYNTAPWENVQIAMVKSPEYKSIEGKRISEISKELNIDPLDFVFDLLIKEQGSVKTLVFCMDEEDIKTIMKHPHTIIASDGRAVAPYGELNKGITHPRYYGAFPRVLGKYVRDEKVLSLETAIKKMTSMPAKTMRLGNRGILATNKVADITIFDPKTVCDVATYENPHQYSKGIEKVILSGKIIIDKGNHTNKLVGQVIK
ncbi:MAG: D-aminoacylase [Deltaproteobacteria bacterium]|nr:MAG: D-aminoacylase [Deltaproteobacteria bacterium]